MTAKRPSLPTLYVITFVLAACSLLYELLIAQTLTMLAANMVVWYSLTVGTYLLAMGIGALLCDRLYGNREAWAGLYRAEIALTVLGGLAVVVLHLAHILHAYMQVWDWEASSRLVFFGTAVLVTFLIGIFTGFELPLLIRIGNEMSADRRVTNRVLGVDYIGALGAGVGFPLVLLPHLELMTIGFLAAGVNLIVAAYVLFRCVETLRRGRRAVSVAGACALLLLLGLLNLGPLEQYFLQKYYYYYDASDSLAAMFAPMPGFPRVFRDHSYYQKIDIVRGISPQPTDMLLEAYSTKFRNHPVFPRNYHLFLNGDYQLNSDYEEIYHEYLAHVPMILNGRVPERVLILGAGDGCLAREILKYDQVKEVVLVDIDPKLLVLARVHPILTAMNAHALDDPRMKLVAGDAYQFLRHGTERFDGIFIDFPYVVDYNLSKLYSVEFYLFLKNRIADGGFAALDAPAIGLFTWPDKDGAQRIDRSNDWPFYYETIRKAGFGTILPYAANLETDNGKAYEILEHTPLDPDFFDGAPSDAPEARLEAMKKIVTEHVVSLQYGFIYMKPGASNGIPPYRDPGVELNILDEKRYGLAFELQFPMPEAADPDKVNSIMRPTLPTLSFWYTRLPW